MENYITILKQLKASGKEFTKADITLIGSKARKLYELATGKKPPKVLQKEGAFNFKVRAYPVGFTGDIDKIIDEHYATKEQEKLL